MVSSTPPAGRETPTVGKSAHAAARVAAVVAMLALGACGGGVYWGFGGVDDTPPSVTIATAATTVQAGQSVRFVAAASDVNGIDEVVFYRVDTGGSVEVGRDGSAPYEANVVAPADGRTSLGVFARAIDNTGNHADSSTVSVTVTQ